MTNPASQWFHDAVSALAYSLAQPHELVPQLERPHNDLTRFILTQHARLPDYLRAPMRLATLLFDLSPALKCGSRFHRQPPGMRRQLVDRWKGSSLGFQRDLIRYFESLATLALYSRGPTGSDTTAAADSSRAGCNAPSAEGRNDGSPGVFSVPPRGELRTGTVVIGSGPGGAITACLLAEAGRDVWLIEEGPFLPLDSCTPFSQEEMLQKYRNGGQTVAMGKNKIAYVEGCCVGGGSEINSGLYHRTPADVLERWRREFSVEALTEKDLAPHFEACERDVSVSLLPGTAPPPSLRLQEGAARLGWKSLEVPRWLRYESAGGGPPKARRQSMTETYIPRFLRAGGRLFPGTRALRLRQTGAAWRLEARHQSAGPLRITADNVFLCGGAIQSAAILRCSGISHNIGNSLQLHPTVKIVARFEREVNAADMGVPAHQVKEFSPRLSFGCSISTPAYLALGLLDHPEAARTTSQAWRHMAIYYAMITSESRGSVRPLPGFRDPLVRYSLSDRDRRNLAEGLRQLSRSLLAGGATALYPGLARSPVLRSAGCLDQLPEILPTGLANLMTVHVFSSCPMGEDQTKCAANSFGRVHRFRNLFLNDTSLLCTAPGVNPQGSVMALARRNTLHYLAGHAG